jgi:hypothetical protein
VFEGWLLLGLAMHHDIPTIDGITINVGVAA